MMDLSMYEQERAKAVENGDSDVFLLITPAEAAIELDDLPVRCGIVSRDNSRIILVSSQAVRTEVWRNPVLLCVGHKDWTVDSGKEHGF